MNLPVDVRCHPGNTTVLFRHCVAQEENEDKFLHCRHRTPAPCQGIGFLPYLQFVVKTQLRDHGGEGVEE